MRGGDLKPGPKAGSAGVVLLLWAAGVLAFEASPDQGALAKDLDRILDRPALASAFVGVEVRSLRTGHVLYARHAEKAFRPASGLKLLTTAAALDLYGPTARLRTTVEAAGRVDSRGRLLGDVYLVGAGDPGLGGGRYGEGSPLREMEALARALREGGVRRIEGGIVGHEGLFSGERRGDDWSWADLVWSYGAEVSALDFNDNAVGLALLPGEAAGEPAVLEVRPPSSYYRVVKTAITSAAGSKSELRLTRDEGAPVIRLSGSLPIDGARWEGWVALPDPARYAATVFSEVLRKEGVEVTGDVSTMQAPRPAGLRELCAHESAPMADLVKAVNKESRNLHAEALLRLLGVRAKGEGTVEAGRMALLEFLTRQDVPVASFGLVDGSGLSRSNVVTPDGLVALLAAMDRHPQAAPFRDSLPVAGVDGTLKDRMKGTAAEGRVRAKTGTLGLVNALAGYADARGGERLAFAAVVNHHLSPREAVLALDALAVRLAQE